MGRLFCQLYDSSFPYLISNRLLLLHFATLLQAQGHVQGNMQDIIFKTHILTVDEEPFIRLHLVFLRE